MGLLTIVLSLEHDILVWEHKMLDTVHKGKVKVKVTQSCLTLCNPVDYGILQARILEWVAYPFSRGSSQPRNQTWVSCIAGGFFILSHQGSQSWHAMAIYNVRGPLPYFLNTLSNLACDYSKNIRKITNGQMMTSKLVHDCLFYLSFLYSLSNNWH